MIMAGGFQLFNGLLVLLVNEFYVNTPNYLFRFDARGGDIHLLVGVLVLLAGFAVLAGQTWGRVVGIVRWPSPVPWRTSPSYLLPVLVSLDDHRVGLSSFSGPWPLTGAMPRSKKLRRRVPHDDEVLRPASGHAVRAGTLSESLRRLLRRTSRMDPPLPPTHSCCGCGCCCALRSGGLLVAAELHANPDQSSGGTTTAALHDRSAVGSRYTVGGARRWKLRPSLEALTRSEPAEDGVRAETMPTSRPTWTPAEASA